MANIEGLTPEAKKALIQANQEYLARYGKPLIPQITSAFRSREKQQQLYDNRMNNPYPVAKPGSSLHESGLALDMGDWQRALPIMQKYGFRQPLPKTDPIHFEYGKVYKQPNKILQTADQITQKQKQIVKQTYIQQQQAAEQQRQQEMTQAYLETMERQQKLQLEAEKNSIQAGVSTPSYQSQLQTSDALKSMVETPQSTNNIMAMTQQQPEITTTPQSLPDYEGKPTGVENTNLLANSFKDLGFSDDEIQNVIQGNISNNSTLTNKLLDKGVLAGMPYEANATQQPLEATSDFQETRDNPMLDVQQQSNTIGLENVKAISDALNDATTTSDSTISSLGRPTNVANLKALPTTPSVKLDNPWSSLRLINQQPDFTLYNKFTNRG